MLNMSNVTWSLMAPPCFGLLKSDIMHVILYTVHATGLFLLGHPLLLNIFSFVIHYFACRLQTLFDVYFPLITYYVDLALCDTLILRFYIFDSSNRALNESRKRFSWSFLDLRDNLFCETSQSKNGLTMAHILNGHSYREKQLIEKRLSFWTQ